MKGLAVTHKGIEDITALEIKELIKAEGAINPSAVEFEVQKLADLCTLCYRAQSVSRILLLLFKFRVDHDLAPTMDAFAAALDCSDTAELLSKASTFKVECERMGSHGFNSPDVAREAGAAVMACMKAKSAGLKVALKDPIVQLFVYITDGEGYAGIDMAGFDLAKREYKVFGSSPTIKAPLAYAAVRISGIKDKGLVIDTFSGSGLILIEAVMFLSSYPPRYFQKRDFLFQRLPQLAGTDFDRLFAALDKLIKPRIKAKLMVIDSQMHALSASKKNAKIAGINKLLSFSRQDIEWLDTRFEKATVDAVITYIQKPGKQSNSAEVEKLYHELFYQLEFIVKKTGIVLCITPSLDMVQKHAEKFCFVTSHSRKVWSGEQELCIVAYRKGAGKAPGKGNKA